MTSFAVAAIGKVEGPLTQPESVPRQPDKGAPAAWLVFAPEVLEGLQSIRPGNALVLVTWLDRARRDVRIREVTAPESKELKRKEKVDGRKKRE